MENRRLQRRRTGGPNGSIGFRWGEKGKWNLEPRAAGKRPNCAVAAGYQQRRRRGLPLLWRQREPAFSQREQEPVLIHPLPAKR
jgi:nitrate reductase alpha subunit